MEYGFGVLFSGWVVICDDADLFRTFELGGHLGSPFVAVPVVGSARIAGCCISAFGEGVRVFFAFDDDDQSFGEHGLADLGQVVEDSPDSFHRVGIATLAEIATLPEVFGPVAVVAPDDAVEGLAVLVQIDIFGSAHHLFVCWSSVAVDSTHDLYV